ncbi:MAG: hypothetical protein ACOX6T_02930 [Myxococcales bacterium]|jgi:hypothetical protein
MRKAAPSVSSARLLDTFCRPLPLAAVAVLALNDHVLKGSGLAPAWLTGKLSDFAGLFFFPLFLAAVVGLVVRSARASVLVVSSAAATALLFALIKSVPEASAAYELAAGSLRGVGRVRNACDPTDLIALPMCLFAVL